MCVGKAGTYLSGEPYSFSRLVKAIRFICKHLTRIEKFDRDKHSSFLRKFVNRGRKKFHIKAQCYKTFYVRYLRIFVITIVLVSGRSFQSSLMYEG
jgi:hypothetical protein